MSNETNIHIYAEQSNVYSRIIINHLITNEIDAIHFLIMYMIMFILYSYQCIKISSYARKNNRYIDFQLLFCILNLIRIMQISYASLGYEMDQWSNEWKIEKKKVLYCDPSLQYDIPGKCHSLYEINGIFQNLYLYLGIVVIQIISFFWQKQITPLMFISIYKVLMNQYIPLKTKLTYLFFIIIDIIMLLCQIFVWILGYNEQSFFTLRIFQIVFAGFTALNLFYIIYAQDRDGEITYRSNRVKVYCIAIFVIARTGFIVMRLLKFDDDEANKIYKKTHAQSIIYLCFNVLEVVSRIFMIKLF